MQEIDDLEDDEIETDSEDDCDEEIEIYNEENEADNQGENEKESEKFAASMSSQEDVKQIIKSEQPISLHSEEKTSALASKIRISSTTKKKNKKNDFFSLIKFAFLFSFSF